MAHRCSRRSSPTNGCASSTPPTFLVSDFTTCGTPMRRICCHSESTPRLPGNGEDMRGRDYARSSQPRFAGDAGGCGRHDGCCSQGGSETRQGDLQIGTDSPANGSKAVAESGWPQMAPRKNQNDFNSIAWQEWRDSNPQPPGLETRGLAIELHS